MGKRDKRIRYTYIYERVLYLPQVCVYVSTLAGTHIYDDRRRKHCVRMLLSYQMAPAWHLYASEAGARLSAYASRHRPSVWPTMRRYPTERRTATTRVPSPFSPHRAPSLSSSPLRPLVYRSIYPVVLYDSSFPLRHWSPLYLLLKPVHVLRYTRYINCDFSPTMSSRTNFTTEKAIHTYAFV